MTGITRRSLFGFLTAAPVATVAAVKNAVTARGFTFRGYVKAAGPYIVGEKLPLALHVPALSDNEYADLRRKWSFNNAATVQRSCLNVPILESDDIIDIPNFLSNAAETDPAVVAAETSYSPANSVVTSIRESLGDGDTVSRTGNAVADAVNGTETSGMDVTARRDEQPFSNTVARDRQPVVTVSGFSPGLEAVTSIAPAAGEGHPAAVTQLGASEQTCERVIFIPAFLRGAPSARDGIEPDCTHNNNCN